MKRIIILTMISISILLTACSNNTEEISQNTNDSTYTEDVFVMACKELIQKGETKYQVVKDEFIFIDDDRMDVSSDTNGYRCDNAIYIQVKDFMFRFQLNEERRIESYIKFTLIG